MTQAKQGHAYYHGGYKVIALEDGALPHVRQVDPQSPFSMGRRYQVRASLLTPAPMKYFHGEIPQ